LYLPRSSSEHEADNPLHRNSLSFPEPGEGLSVQSFSRVGRNVEAISSPMNNQKRSSLTFEPCSVLEALAIIYSSPRVLMYHNNDDLIAA
jgi:hypothetical protein